MQLLVRFGLIPQVVRCPVDPGLELTRGASVLFRTSRGLELGTVLEATPGPTRELALAGVESVLGGHAATGRIDAPVAAGVTVTGPTAGGEISGEPSELVPSTATGVTAAPAGCQFERIATADDLRTAQALRAEAEESFALLQQRFDDWRLQLELLDLEWFHDRARLIVYVLGGRGAETTRLSLLAAAAGAGSIEVQPVSTEGLVPAQERSGGGCGSGGCGCRP